MLAEYKKKANTVIGLAIVTMIVLGLIAALTAGTSGRTHYILEDILILSMLPFIYGLCCYAKGKGYHGAWGLLGLLTIIGIIILVCFPDRHKSTKENQRTSQTISKSGNR